MPTANETVKKVLTRLNQKIDSVGGGVVDSWTSDDGNQWYRKYSNGWIEQGGLLDMKNENTPVTFNVQFSKIPEFVSVTHLENVSNYLCVGTVVSDTLTTTGVTVVILDFDANRKTGKAKWIAIGY